MDNFAAQKAVLSVEKEILHRQNDFYDIKSLFCIKNSTFMQ